MARAPRIGMVGRFFPNNWRPPLDEIAFARAADFEALQVRTDHPATVESVLRSPLREIGAALAAAAVEPTLETLVRVDGDTPPLREVLEQNVAALDALGIRRVHLHLVLADPAAPALDALERRLAEELAEAAEHAAGRGLVFGFEHNPRYERLFGAPASCARVLDASDEIGFVWDVNHTAPEDVAAFQRLLPRTLLIHASDARLPETNHHLPIGLGTIDFRAALAPLRDAGADVPIVLEIGGLRRSGGVGRDTDEALRDSRARLVEAWS